MNMYAHACMYSMNVVCCAYTWRMYPKYKTKLLIKFRPSCEVLHSLRETLESRCCGLVPHKLLGRGLGSQRIFVALALQWGRVGPHRVLQLRVASLLIFDIALANQIWVQHVSSDHETRHSNIKVGAQDGGDKQYRFNLDLCSCTAYFGLDRSNLISPITNGPNLSKEV